MSTVVLCVHFAIHQDINILYYQIPSKIYSSVLDKVIDGTATENDARNLSLIQVIVLNDRRGVINQSILLGNLTKIDYGNSVFDNTHKSVIFIMFLLREQIQQAVPLVVNDIPESMYSSHHEIVIDLLSIRHFPDITKYTLISRRAGRNETVISNRSKN